MIKGLSRLLQKIEPWPEVKGIIPGRIQKANAKGSIRLRVSYETPSGLKAIARGNSSVQEVFFITDQPDLLAKKLEEFV